MLPSPFNVKQLAELPSIHEIEATQGGATPRRPKRIDRNGPSVSGSLSSGVGP